jgi:pyrroloquinoline quinone biosynthesis protein B
MRAVVLGSAAGGGVPQWNCGCANCGAVRGGLPVSARTQAGLAVSADDQHWFLLGASPDVAGQIEATRALWPRPPRRSPIVGVVLHTAELDATLGLFSLREGQPLSVHATPAVREAVRDRNVMARALDRAVWRDLEPGTPVPLVDAEGTPSGLEVIAVPTPRPLPRHLQGVVDDDPGMNVGLVIRDRSTSLAYFPRVGGPSPAIERALREADVVLWDGTVWSADELHGAGAAADVSDQDHWPLGGPTGSLGLLASVPSRRRLLVHVNNTNPILRAGSAAHSAALSAGIRVACDGEQILPWV